MSDRYYVAPCWQIEIKAVERPECIQCNSSYSLKHVLLDCVDVADVRQTFYNSLYNIFTNVAGDTILKFLKEIDLYTKNRKGSI